MKTTLHGCWCCVAMVMNVGMRLPIRSSSVLLRYLRVSGVNSAYPIKPRINIKGLYTMATLDPGSGLLFRQLFDRDSCTYTYLLADCPSKEAIIIDPVIELAERDVKMVNQLGLTLKYALNTHMHADHITGSGLLKKLVPGLQSVIAESSGADADIKLVPGQRFTFGDQELEVRSTPGHTSGCVTFVMHKHRMAFTGDAILIRGCGRTDFQEGNAQTLYESVHSQIFSLPDEYSLYPAHDYDGQTVTSVREEKLYNPRLTKPLEEFVEIMEGLGLPYPRKIDASLPANKVCGLYNLPDDLAAKLQAAEA